MRLQLAIAVIIVVGGILLTWNSSQGHKAAAFTLPDPYGSEVSLASYSGHKVLLVFWTTSCGICRRELPLVNGMATELMKKGVSVVAIHVGQEDVRDYLRSNGIDLLTVVDGDGAVAQAYHVSGVPKLVLVGEDGRVRRSQLGMADEDTLREWAGRSD